MRARFPPMFAHLRGTALAALAVLLVSGCSSKNPDALTGMNVDENLAIMNAEESSAVNSGATHVSDTTSSPHKGNSRSDRSADGFAATARERGQLTNQEGSAEVNSVGASSDGPSDQEGAGFNQVENQMVAPPWVRRD